MEKPEIHTLDCFVTDKDTSQQWWWGKGRSRTRYTLSTAECGDLRVGVRMYDRAFVGHHYRVTVADRKLMRDTVEELQDLDVSGPPPGLTTCLNDMIEAVDDPTRCLGQPGAPPPIQFPRPRPNTQATQWKSLR
jgi:hypothetical protein